MARNKSLWFWTEFERIWACYSKSSGIDGICEEFLHNEHFEVQLRPLQWLFTYQGCSHGLERRWNGCRNLLAESMENHSRLPVLFLVKSGGSNFLPNDLSIRRVETLQTAQSGPRWRFQEQNTKKQENTKSLWIGFPKRIGWKQCLKVDSVEQIEARDGSKKACSRRILMFSVW